MIFFHISMFIIFSVHSVSAFSFFPNSVTSFGLLSAALRPTFSEVSNGAWRRDSEHPHSVKSSDRSSESGSFFTMCPKPCSCSPSLPPPILPGLWDVPPRPHTTPSLRSVSVSMSCTGLALRSVPALATRNDDLTDPHIVVELDLSDNALSELPASALLTYPHLQHLRLSRNNVHKIAPDAFVSTPLRVLLLDDNSLVSLPYDLSLPPLEELSLQKNFFESIPSPVTRLLSLRALNMAENVLPALRADELSHLPNLVTLSLNHNRISEVHPQALAALPSLENLDLANNLLTDVPTAVQLCPSISHLVLADNRIKVLRHDAFRGLRNLQSVTLHGNPLHRVHPKALSALPALSTIVLQEVSELRSFPDLTGTTSLETVRFDRSALAHVPRNLCSLVPNLKSLNLHRNALDSLPHLELCGELRLLDLSHNLISTLSENQFVGQRNLQDLILHQNRITVLDDGVFSGLTRLQTLNLEFNQITTIGPKAFLPLLQLKDINLGNNDLKEFPEEGLEHVVTLKVHHNRHLRVFPGPERFPVAHTLVLSYAYHCCAFLRDENYDDASEEPPKYIEDVIYNVEDIQDFDNSLLLNMSDIWSGMGKGDSLVRPAAPPPPKLHLSAIQQNHLEKSSSAAPNDLPLTTDSAFVSDVSGEDFGSLWSKLVEGFTPEVVGGEAPGSVDLTTARSAGPRAPVLCIPKPGPFMPCRDLFDWWTLRCGVWIVFLLALLGNGTVVVVLCFARSKLDVPRFLVANLALADFFMGIYLGFLAVVDASTLGEFRMYAIPWQMSTGCQAAGFIGVLSSELSVYTLTVITLERNYAITHAMHLNKRLSLRHAAYVMLGGWVFAGTMAALPLIGVSDYRKFAVCLPFETGGGGLWYVVILMFINGSAFVILMMCYLKIYCSIRGSQAWNSNDSRIAKRMALLVFTDFICLAPIAFFSVTAAFGLHLITLEEAKVFTVFVLPFNSCCNPFLYALLTKQFKKDCVTLCKTIEESRVTRGIGRCRHSSNFSNRQTPAHTNSAVEQSTRSNGEDCNCQSKKQPPPNFSQRVRISILKFFYCHRRRSKRNMSNEFNNEQNKLANKNFRNTSLSSDAYSSSYSDNWKRGKMPLSLRLLDRRRHSSWYLTRKPSQESNLSSSRNDSSATTASTSTWRISRSSVSSDISSGASRVLGKNDSQMSLKLGSFRERRADSRGGMNSTVMVLQHAPNNGNSFKRPKPKLQRQTAVERETYLTNNLACDAIGVSGNKAVKRDNLSCVYEQDSFEEEDMTQVTAFLTPTYRLAGLAVGFIPRKLSTISSQSVSVNKDLDTEASPEDSSPEERLFSTGGDKNCDVENGLQLGAESNSTSVKFPPTPKDRPRSRHLRSRRCPSDSNLRRRCESPSHRCLGGDYIRRVATMPLILSPLESSSITFDVSPPAEEDDVFLHPTAPEGLLETHFPLEEPPGEGDPLL